MCTVKRTPLLFSMTKITRYCIKCFRYRPVKTNAEERLQGGGKNTEI
jgi:hypothetical protein